MTDTPLFRFFTEGLERKADLHFRVHQALMIGLAFLFPFAQFLLPLFAILLGINAFLYGLLASDRLGTAYRAKKERVLPFLLTGFFLLYLVGTAYTDHFSEALFDLQKKIGFLFFPLLFLFMPAMKEKEGKRVLFAFVLGCCVAAILGFIQALVNFYGHSDHHLQYLYGGYFAFEVHRGYLAIYFLFGASAALWLINNKRKGDPWIGRKQLLVPAFLLVLVALFMTASRSSILVLPVLVLLIVFRDIKGSWRFRWGLLGILFAALIALLILFPKNYQRLKESYRTVVEVASGKGVEEVETGKMRLKVWSVGSGIFLDHWLKGMGTGDDDKALEKKYRGQGWDMGEFRGMDVHCQYLQTGIALGIPGILLLVGILFRTLLVGYRSNLLLLVMGTVLLVTAFFESVLERQAGILFFACFLPFMAVGWNYGKEEEAHEVG
ncbi:MAG: O-antigen ligase family protein [Flavobacteriales bacterium]